MECGICGRERWVSSFSRTGADNSQAGYHRWGRGFVAGCEKVVSPLEVGANRVDTIIPAVSHFSADLAARSFETAAEDQPTADSTNGRELAKNAVDPSSGLRPPPPLRRSCSLVSTSPSRGGGKVGPQARGGWQAEPSPGLRLDSPRESEFNCKLTKNSKAARPLRGEGADGPRFHGLTKSCVDTCGRETGPPPLDRPASGLPKRRPGFVVAEFLRTPARWQSPRSQDLYKLPR